MRPLEVNREKVGGVNLMERNSLVPAAQELWNKWEIHCLILASLFLQVFLFLFAGMRRRCSSRLLGIVLWLAYLSADSVAIFVLGHLAVRAGEPGHQLMSVRAPFMLVHLGGQDTISAFSKQDNELWLRHLLNLITQAAVAGYVVTKTSWPDRRLEAATVVMFLSALFKYAERTSCLYFASPARLRSDNLGSLSRALQELQEAAQGPSYRHIVYFSGETQEGSMVEIARQDMRKTLDMVSRGGIAQGSFAADVAKEVADDIISVDVPLNTVHSILVADELPGMLAEFLMSNADSYEAAYAYVGECLGRCYLRLYYTKHPLREIFILALVSLPRFTFLCWQQSFAKILILMYALFQLVSTPIALVLFTAAAEKGAQLHASSRADITVSYALLVGAIILDVSYTIMSINYFLITFLVPDSSMIKRAILREANYMKPPWFRKKWSEKLAGYNMIERHAVQDTTASIWQCIGKHLGCSRLLDVTRKPITKDHTAITKFSFDNLLLFGTSREDQWNFSSSRGHIALQKWKDNRNQLQAGSDSTARPTKALEESISGVDFPTSVLIWHIATDICYYCTGDEDSTDSDEMKHKQVSTELSNYIMYLVFKCGVLLTTNSQLIHDKAHKEIRRILFSHQRPQRGSSQGGKAAVTKLLYAKKEEYSTVHIKNHEEHANSDNDADNHIRKKLLQRAQALDAPVLPRAFAVAQELISISKRWDLIASVWSEMLFFTAPRCGAAFHYEHLSTGVSSSRMFLYSCVH